VPLDALSRAEGVDALFDAAIIGAGPAGASCALWLARLGCWPILIDAAAAPGGLLRGTPFRNDWIATQPGLTGYELAANLGVSLREAGVPMIMEQRVEAVSGQRDDFTLHRAGGPALTSRHVVLATGVEPVRGGLTSGENILIGPGRHVAEAEFSGQRIAVLGGGDNALENYGFIRSRGASAVHVYARTLRGQRAAIAAADPDDLRVGTYDVDERALRVNGQAYDRIVVMYGWTPSPLPKLQEAPARDARGFVEVDSRTCETSLPGVFAIGEVTRRNHPSVVTAMADGIVAAKAIQARAELA
jgi:thioredoxin reductase (NADPH)